MANKYIGETSGKYWKQKNDETYVNEDELVKITDLEESDSVEDDDLLIKGNPSTGKMLKIKIANFLDGIKEKLLGSTDISSVGDGTVTGAISENAKGVSDNEKSISQNADDIAKNKEETDAAIEELSDDVDKKYDELNSALAAYFKSGGRDSFTANEVSFDGAQRVTATITYPSAMTSHDFALPICVSAQNGYVAATFTSIGTSQCTILLQDIRGAGQTGTSTPAITYFYLDK